MTREEALQAIKEKMDYYESDKRLRGAIETLIPELTESEDERIIKTLQEYVKNRNWPLNGPTQDEVLAWLEKQKESLHIPETCKENADSFTDDEKIRKELIEYHKRQFENNRDQEVGLFHKDAIAYLEKQKDASKAIEAVDRIDKYIDEHLANAHDMKDSNPDKKYYRGWDDALGEMARILQDVYSGEKQKEQKDYNKLYEDIGKSEWFKKAYEGKSLGCDYEQKEQKPIEPSNEELQRYQNELYDFKVFATKQAKEHHISHVHDFEWNNFCAGLLSYFNEQKSAEWSDEDSDNLERVDNYLWMLDDYVGDDCAMPQGKTDKIRGNIQEVLSPWLKNLPKRFSPQPKQEWSEDDESFLDSIEEAIHSYYDLNHAPQYDYWLEEKLKSLRPWKPNVEKLYYDRVNKEFYVKETINDPKSAIQELYKRLNKR